MCCDALSSIHYSVNKNRTDTKRQPRIMELPPSQTLYINNINEKVKKEVLKKTLYALFAQFGRIIEIVACKGLKLRGQAWVVFQDVTAATNALRRMQGFNFYDKPLRIAFSKQKSDIVAKKDNSFQPREKRKYQEIGPSKKAAGDDTERPAKAPKLIVNNVPHRILFAQNLPENCTDQMLTMLFQNYPGFMEVRMAPGKKGIAFIEFQDQIQAGIALSSLNGFSLSETEKLHLTFGNQ